MGTKTARTFSLDTGSLATLGWFWTAVPFALGVLRVAVSFVFCVLRVARPAALGEFALAALLAARVRLGFEAACPLAFRAVRELPLEVDLLTAMTSPNIPCKGVKRGRVWAPLLGAARGISVLVVERRPPRLGISPDDR